MLLGLSYARKFDDDWFSDIRLTLNHIDNDLRIRRNAAIHSEWFIPSRGLIRRSKKTKLVKPQSYQISIETQQNIPVKLSELRRIQQDMDKCWMASLPLLWYMIDWQRTIDQGEILPYKTYIKYAHIGIEPSRLKRRSTAVASK